MAVQSPVYRVLLRNSSSVVSTIVVAGPHRRMVWLYGHGVSPMVLRLGPEVVGFLRGVFEDLRRERGTARHWSLAAGRANRHPGCVVTDDGERVALHVLAQSPSTLDLTEPVVAFLADVLGELPAVELVA